MRKILKYILWKIRIIFIFRYYSLRSCIIGDLMTKTLAIKSLVSFQAPVRFSGAGKIEVFDKVKFGYYDAPRMGNGEILIQARDSDALISIGVATAFSNNISLIARNSIKIGEGCLLGDSVQIIDSDFHEIQPELRHVSSGGIAPVVIGNNVWLGSRVVVLKGVTIGENSGIAAGAVVCSNIPMNVIAGGVPAKVLRDLG